MNSYVPLWCKSNYSFLEGASHPEELVAAGAELSLPTLALTDRNGVYGAVKAFDQSRKLGRPLILGSEISIGEGSLVLLAQDREGYARLCGLLSLGHKGRAKGEFAVSEAQVAEHAEGLVALWRAEGGVKLEGLADAFQDRLYAAISRHRWVHDPRKERETLEQAAHFGVPPVAVTEVLYHRAERQELQNVLTCIRHKVRLADAGTRLKPNAEHAIKSASDFAELYSDHPEWVGRTLAIAEQCRFSLGDIQYLYPEEGVPEGYTTPEWLRHLTYEGAQGRYRAGIPLKVRLQVDKELDLIRDLQYSGYFLTMWEIVQFCRKSGILCQGRGSAANSAVCFCLGITAINPVEVNLLFERFLSRERAEPPDIDLDIEHNRREEVIQHMYELYGRDRAAMVANVVRYRSRSALREVGKVLDVSKVDLDQSAKLLSHHDEGMQGAVRDAGLDLSLPINQKLLELAQQFKGFPRHLSIHPGGFLLGTEAISRIVPQEPATMPGRTVIQWDKTDVETMNLFKVDLLGLGALTHLDYAFQLLKKHRGIELSMAAIPQDDTATYDLICRADTVGVFQIESRAQMSMLPRLKPRNYYDIVVEVSLVRPGPISGGMVHPYLRRRQGKEEISYPHPCLIPVLEKTKGIPLFQEQVMSLAMAAADYTPGEADQLRRDMAAWKQKGELERHHEKLVTRMQAKGIETEFAERIFSQIKGFGEYGFPESHAASFALIAYATAWMKANHPDAFSCALLNAWPMGFYAPMTIIGDAKRHGVTVLPVNIMKSEWDCTLEEKTGFQKFAIRIGLRYIKGLSRKDADAILTRRDRALPLASWKAESRASSEAWEKLAVSGALEDFGIHRRAALWQVLDPGEPDPLFTTSETQEFAEPTRRETISWDYNTQDHSARAHLLEQFRPILRREKFKAAVEISTIEKPQIARHAGVVICRQRPGTANGVMFITLEDETGVVNVVVWTKVWEKYRRVILTSSILAVEGKLQIEDTVIHLVAERFWSPEGLLEAGEVTLSSHDFH